MKKITTSDQLKLVFQAVLKTNAEDWQRMGGKAKNADGQWVRKFENKKTGVAVTVTEMEDGYFNIKGKGLEANVRLPSQFLKAATPAAQPVVDQIMDIVLKSRRDIPEALLKKADRNELASRFSFYVVDEPDMGGVMAIVTPKGLDDEYSKRSSAVMEFLFPKAEYIDDSVYGMWQLDKKQNRAQLGAELAKAGFEWDAYNKKEILAVKAKPASKNSRKPR